LRQESVVGKNKAVEELRARWAAWQAEWRRRLSHPAFKQLPRKPVPDDSPFPWGPMLGGGLMLLVAGSIWHQLGFAGLLRYYFVFMVGVAGIAILSAARVVAMLVLVGATLALVWTYAGTRSVLLDLGAVALALALTAAWRRRAMARSRPAVDAPADPAAARAAAERGADRITTVSALLFLVLLWIFGSAADGWTQRTPLARTAASPLVAASATAAGAQRPAARVGLALSGGGYRAALYHAGVLQALQDHGIAASAMASVSGGSIIGAYYARGGAPQDFVQAVADGRFNLGRELLRLDHAARIAASARIPGTDTKLLSFAPDYDQTRVQADLLDRLFGGGIRHRDGSIPGRPQLMICVTDILQRAMIGIMPTGYVVRSVEPPTLRFGFANRHNTATDVLNLSGWSGQADDLPGPARLADLVAASGAFPLAFAPFSLQAGAPGQPPREHLLVDGGVADNLGVAMADAAVRRARAAKARLAPGEGPSEPWDVDFLIVSDASAIQPPDAGAQAPRGPVEAFDRTLDLIYDNGRLAEFVAGGADAVSLPTLAVSPALLLERTARQQLDASLDFPFGPGTAPPARLDDIAPHSMLTTDTRTIGAIVARMRKDRRGEAEVLIDALKRDKLWPEAGLLQPSRLADDSLRRLHDILSMELTERMDVFRRTSTLQAQFDDYTAQSLFLLGYYLATLDMRYVDCQIERAQAQRSKAEAVPSCRAAPVVRFQRVGRR
jgi:predicted acylesterase/phospholipase RssA